MPTGKYERTSENNAKMSIALRGKQKSKNHCKAVQAAVKLQHAINPNYAMKGKHHSEETKQKMRDKALMRHDLNVELGRRNGLASRGRKQSAAARKAHSIAGKRHWKNCVDETCGMCRHNNPSNLAWQAYDLLLQDFTIVIPEQRFGQYSVDFLLAEEWLAVEVDGEYWHKNRGWKDMVKDWYLTEYHNLPVIRISEHDIKDMLRVHGTRGR